MKERIITGVLAGVVLLTLLFTSNIIAIKITVGIISVLSLYEFYGAVGVNKKNILLIAGVVISLLLFVDGCVGSLYIKPILCFSVIILGLIMMFSDGKISFADICFSLFGIFYIVFTMLHIVYTRELNYGKYYLFVIIFGACVTDIFAYFVGVFFGKHKLCEKISPKKTIEGAIGGLCGSVIVMLLTGVVILNISSDITDVNYLSLGILGILCSVFAQFGDLTASVIKRQFGIKDYGHILPGHGGFMDRIDSIIFVAPLVYYFITIIPIFN